MESRRLLFATNLDGCLLDPDTYRYDGAREALAALRRERIPLVLASGKTRAEMTPLAEELGIEAPMIVENGGAVLVRVRGSGGGSARRRRFRRFVTLELGRRREFVMRELERIARETGAHLRGFFGMTPKEVSALTGLPHPAARRALKREYDEPFVLEDESLAPAIAKVAARSGLRLVRGRHFFHLVAHNDLGLAWRHLLSFLTRGGRELLTVGLGSSAHDRTLLQAVDRPIVMPRQDGSFDPELAQALPNAECAPEPGPSGWSRAVLGVLRGLRLQRVTDHRPERVRPD
jgi:mannosyl-3-phosphoglycerate phosphatase